METKNLYMISETQDELREILKNSEKVDMTKLKPKLLCVWPSEMIESWLSDNKVLASHKALLIKHDQNHHYEYRLVPHIPYQNIPVENEACNIVEVDRDIVK